MKKNYLFIFLSALLGVLFLCCENETDPVILVSSDNFVSQLRADMSARFKVEAHSKKNTLTRIEIKEYTSDYNYRILKDTLIHKADATFFFEYRTPFLSMNQVVKLIFIAYNDKDDNSSTSLSYDYIFEDKLLTEYSGYTMFTLKSGKPDGFSLRSKQIVYTSTSLPKNIDFYSYQDTDTVIDPNLLQRTWKTHTGLNFVKFNGFDYAKATRKSLTESYLAGVRLPIVSYLETEDIILIGFGENPKGVIKVIGVYDEEGYVNDRYVFNAKFYE